MDRILRGIRVRSAPHLERLHVYALPGEVLGQLDMRGAGLLEPSEAKGLADDLRRRVGDADPRRPLRDRRQHPDHVDVLVGLLVDALEPGLARDRNQRRAIELRVGDAGEQVRRSRTERGQADSGIGREASVDVGHERRALLVAREDEADLVALGECGVQSEGLFTGDPKYVLYALVLETPNEKLRDIHDLIGCLHRSPGKRE